MTPNSLPICGNILSVRGSDQVEKHAVLYTSCKLVVGLAAVLIATVFIPCRNAELGKSITIILDRIGHF